MGDVFWRGGNQEEDRPTSIIWFKMEYVCNFCKCWNYLPKKSNQNKKKKAFSSFETPNGIGTIV